MTDFKFYQPKSGWELASPQKDILLITTSDVGVEDKEELPEGKAETKEKMPGKKQNQNLIKGFSVPHGVGGFPGQSYRICLAIDQWQLCLFYISIFRMGIFSFEVTLFMPLCCILGTCALDISLSNKSWKHGVTFQPEGKDCAPTKDLGLQT